MRTIGLAAVAIDNARSYQQARSAIRTREEILAVVSHDLRSPLSAIEIGAGLLLRLPSKPEDRTGDEPGDRAGTRSDVAHIAGIIQRSTEHMQRLINDLLDFSALQADRLELEREDHDAETLVIEALQSMEPVATAKGVRLDDDTGRLRAVVSCDRQKLARVFANLIGNAIKFTHAGGSVVVGARIEDRTVVFSVRDTGTGIPADELDHVFDRYWQASRKRGEGFGLGLAIVKGIIEAHDGVVRVESAVGQGSTFSFSLPLGG